MTGIELIYEVKKNFENTESIDNHIEICFNRSLSIVITYLILNKYTGEIPKTFIEYLNFLKDIAIGEYIKDNTVPMEIKKKTILNHEYRINEEILILFNSFKETVGY
ncbi:hypothetical protein [Clostridium hydrogeniformans]|uniref:hypothetical protein n=1 Tax=Clostridium hydrogeniformans TaxID=349933 RepID=UPI000489976F|nr:hypothetical protein [Clostridium hydrogeniformans]